MKQTEYKRSLEVREKIANTLKGRERPQATKEKISQGLTGSKWTAEHKANFMKARWGSKEE